MNENVDDMQPTCLLLGHYASNEEAQLEYRGVELDYPINRCLDATLAMLLIGMSTYSKK